jgi:hypothetical protein
MKTKSPSEYLRQKFNIDDSVTIGSKLGQQIPLHEVESWMKEYVAQCQADNTSQPQTFSKLLGITDAQTADFEFMNSKQLTPSEVIQAMSIHVCKLLNKLQVDNAETNLCVSCDENKPLHNICYDCITKLIDENKQADNAELAIKFADWINKNDYEKIGIDKWYSRIQCFTIYTTKELYDIYLIKTSLNKGKYTEAEIKQYIKENEPYIEEHDEGGYLGIDENKLAKYILKFLTSLNK